MADKRLTITIDAEDNASKTFEKLGKSAGGLQKSLKPIADGLKKIGIAASAAGVGLFALATKSAFSAARVEELGFALDAIAKANKVEQKEVDETVKKLRQFNIAHDKALQTTALFIQSQLDLADATKLANVAKDLAVIGAVDSSQATRTLTEAISSQNVLMLRQFGIVKTSAQIFDEYAKKLNKGNTAVVVNTKKTATNVAKLAKYKNQLTVTNARIKEFGDKTKESTKLAAGFKVEELTGKISALEGKTTSYSKAAGRAGDSLTEAEKKQAFLNAILTEGAKVAGTYESAMGSVSKRFRSLTGRIIPDFMAKVGKAFSPALTVIVDAIADAISNLSKFIDENQDTIDDWGLRLQVVAEGVVDIFGRMVEFLINNKEIVIGVFTALGIAAFAFGVSLIVAQATAIAVFTAISAAVALLLKIWNTNFLGIRDAILRAIDNIVNWKDIIVGIFEIIKDKVRRFRDDWTRKVEESIEPINKFIDAVQRAIDKVREFFGLKGGKSFGVTGSFQHGGTVPGAFNQPVPAILHGGERVISRTGTDVNVPEAQRGVEVNITIEGDVSSMDTLEKLTESVSSAISRENELAQQGLGV